MNHYQRTYEHWPEGVEDAVYYHVDYSVEYGFHQTRTDLEVPAEVQIDEITPTPSAELRKEIEAYIVEHHDYSEDYL